MKITAIRGCDLASLAGEFSVELDEPPLRDAGLFAITGQTGAGKSTLLDAVCLALFDRTPRLGHKGGAPIGREDDAHRLGAQDVRGLLRRGCGQAWAECDFVGRDGKRYRARWSVHRAHNRPDGQFRPQELTLRSLPELQPIGRTKTEVQQAIVDRLGLSFEQFCRSALLAQGDFAAFLKADKNGRGELLERMTGTEIYGRISQAAHERNRREQEQLAHLERDLSHLRPLPDDVVARLTTEHQEAVQRCVDLEARRHRALELLNEARDRSRVERELAQAQRELDEAERSLATLGAFASRLETLEQARGAFATLATRDRHQQAYDRLAEQLASLPDALAHARSRRAIAVARLEDLSLKEQALERRRVAQEQELELAATLDREVAAASASADALTQAAQSAQAEHAHAQSHLQSLDQQLLALDAQTAQATSWLGEHPTPARLARDPATSTESARALRSLTQLQDQLGSLLVQTGGHHDVVLVAEGALAQAEAQATQLKAELEAIRARHAQAEQALSSGTPQARLSKELAQLAEQEAELRPLWGLLQHTQQLEEKLGGASKAALDAGRAERAARQALKPAQEAQLRAEIQREEAQRALDRAQAELQLLEHRARLRRGEPCPLCGAEEHPYAHPSRANVPSTFAQEQALRVAALEQAAQQAVQQAQAALAAHSDAERHLIQSEGALQKLEDSLAQAEVQWAASGQKTPLRPAPAAQAQLKERLAALQAARSALQARVDEAAQHQQTLAECTAALGAALQKAEQQGARVAEARRAVDDARQRKEQHRSQVEGLRERQARESQALGLEGVPGRGGLETLARELGLATEHVAKLSEVRRQLLPLQAEREALGASLGQLRARAQEALSRGQEALATLQSKQRERAGRLGGQTVQQVQAQLRKELEALSKEQRQVEKERADAERDEASLKVRAEEGERMQREHQDELTRDELELKGHLLPLGLSTEDLRLLHSQQGELADRQGELQRAQSARVSAEAKLVERRAQRERLPPATGEDEGALVQSSEGLRLELEKAQHQRAELWARLGADAELRKRHLALEPEVARARARADVWRAMDELIGSANGAKFKNFAQGLTLDALIAHTNHHLGQLARRYSLQRVPGHDLELQVVDHDLADEVRAVESLSGGESFLVSLALALGLSSLASRDAQVETLFIDEGLGTLDPDSLEVALSTLDALQSQGRQLGLISHLPNLAERVGAQVRVQRVGAGRSRVSVVAAFGPPAA